MEKALHFWIMHKPMRKFLWVVLSFTQRRRDLTTSRGRGMRRYQYHHVIFKHVKDGSVNLRIGTACRM
jgi:hypothetical protein